MTVPYQDRPLYASVEVGRRLPQTLSASTAPPLFVPLPGEQHQPVPCAPPQALGPGLLRDEGVARELPGRC